MQTKSGNIKNSTLALIDFIRQMVVNDCDDEMLSRTISSINMPITTGALEEDYVNYDEALRELGIGYNRNKLKMLADKHGIKNHRFRNVPIGFLRSDIEKLKKEIEQDSER